MAPTNAFAHETRLFAGGEHRVDLVTTREDALLQIQVFGTLHTPVMSSNIWEHAGLLHFPRPSRVFKTMLSFTSIPQETRIRRSFVACAKAYAHARFGMNEVPCFPGATRPSCVLFEMIDGDLAFALE